MNLIYLIRIETLVLDYTPPKKKKRNFLKKILPWTKMQIKIIITKKKKEEIVSYMGWQ